MACTFSDPIGGIGCKVTTTNDLIGFISHSGSRLTVRDVKSLLVVNIFSCIDKISYFEFSPDSSYVMCALFARNAVQVFSLSDPEWKCRINEGVAGIVSAFWVPDSRGIITESDFGIHMSVWSLIDGSSQVISSPKTDTRSGINKLKNGTNMCKFSDCGRFMALVHRLELQDYIGLYSVSPWGELVKFRCRTNDVSEIQWVPNDTHIITVDSPLSYKINVYTPEGNCLHSYEAYQNALGVRSINFFRSPPNASELTNQPSYLLTAIGSYDGKIRLMSTNSWKVSSVLPLIHPRDMDFGVVNINDNDDNSFGITVELSSSSSNDTDNSKVAMLGEKTKSKEKLFSVYNNKPTLLKNESILKKSNIGASVFVKRNIKVLPCLPPNVRESKSLPQMGVSWLGWSPNGGMIAARDESQPRCLWIWESIREHLVALIVQLDPIYCASWRPVTSIQFNKNEFLNDGDGNEEEEESPSSLASNNDFKVAHPLLAYCTGTRRVYFWSENGSSWTDLPQPSSSKSIHEEGNKISIPTMNVTSVEWTMDGKKLILSNKEYFCTCDVSFGISNNTSSPEIQLKEVSSISPINVEKQIDLNNNQSESDDESLLL